MQQPLFYQCMPILVIVVAELKDRPLNSNNGREHKQQWKFFMWLEGEY